MLVESKEDKVHIDPAENLTKALQKAGVTVDTALSLCIHERGKGCDLNSPIARLSRLSKKQQKAVAFLLNEGITYDLEDAISRSPDVVVHENQTLEQFAYNFLDKCYGLHKFPRIIINSIDFKRVILDLEYNGTYWQVGNDIYEYSG